jgi:hypothetical protein
MSSREEISQPGIELATYSLRFGYLSTIIQYFRVVLDHLDLGSEGDMPGGKAQPWVDVI